MSLPDATGIAGAILVPLDDRADARGCLTEMYRASWPGLFPVVQWNACRSRAGVVRGAHVHADYDEFYMLVSGRLVLGLHDIRPDSPTRGRTWQLHWSADDGRGVVVPRGVAHALLIEEDALLAMGLSAYFDPARDGECQWDDPALGFAWPVREVLRSDRDRQAGAYADMVRAYAQRTAQAPVRSGTAIA
jgi:dTDP-4-dehydrorhamnose 3,5-epimerase